MSECKWFYSFVYIKFILNARYGALEGLSKPELAEIYGEEMVQKWRAGLIDRFVHIFTWIFNLKSINHPV